MKNLILYKQKVSFNKIYELNDFIPINLCYTTEFGRKVLKSNDVQNKLDQTVLKNE